MTMGLSAKGLMFSRDRRSVLHRVSLSLGRGEMVALLGANGSGKTTLLRLLLGLLKPDDGIVLLDGQPILSMQRRSIARQIAYVPQRHVPTFPFTVEEIVAMGSVPATGWGGGSSDHGTGLAALGRVGISHLADRVYTALSGGEQQAVLIARAITQGARILLLDEPTAALDPGQSQRVLSVLRQLGAEGFTILATTHDPNQALQAFDRGLVLADAQIIADGACAQVINAETMSRCYKKRFACRSESVLFVVDP